MSITGKSVLSGSDYPPCMLWSIKIILLLKSVYISLRFIRTPTLSGQFRRYFKEPHKPEVTVYFFLN